MGSNPIGDARQHGTQTGKAAKRKPSRFCEFDSHPCYLNWVVFLVAACKTVVTKQARWTTRGSIPSRPTELARSSNGRMRDPHSRDAGSIPSCRKALRVRISPWLLQRLSRVSQRSAGPHKPGPSGATPEPAMTRYANWQSDQVESLVILWVRLPPWSL